MHLQANNEFPLIAGTALSDLCIQLAWHARHSHQEIYICMIDSEG